MSERIALLGYRPTTALRGRIAQIVDRLNALSRQPGIAHTAQAKLLQQDARDLEAIMSEGWRVDLVRKVRDTFASDVQQGFVTSDKQFAIDLLSMALTPPDV
jgi:hypothetical protein